MQDKNSEKPPFVCGRKDDGTFEFGEMYHLALALKCDSKAKAVIRKFPQGSRFLKSLGLSSQLVEELPTTPRSIDEICVILKDTPQNILTNKRREVQKNITDQSKEGKWAGHFKKWPEWSRPNRNRSVLIWLREGRYRPERNLSQSGLQEIINLCQHKDLELSPIIVSAKKTLLSIFCPHPVLCSFYSDPFFDDESIAKQLWFLDQLHQKFDVVANIGMMSGALDGIAFFNYRPVIFFEGVNKSVRMSDTSACMPDELVRIPLEQNPTSQDPFTSFSDNDKKALKIKLKELISKNATSGKP